MAGSTQPWNPVTGPGMCRGVLGLAVRHWAQLGSLGDTVLARMGGGMSLGCVD